jgi:hypothetical protein
VSAEGETIRWPSNLDRAAIEKRLRDVSLKAAELDLDEIRARFAGVDRMSAAQIASGVVACLTWLVNQPPAAREKCGAITRELEMVALNLKNLK